MPAATTAAFRPARSASARCASTRTARCACPGATSPACSAIRSRRSRSFTPGRARWPTASACSAATCTARYCQNWVTSQALRDPQAVAPPRDVDPEDLARDAVRQGARVVVSTYNEPLITVEWAVAVFKAARAQGLATGFVSNGNGDAAGARLPDAVDRSLQGRSQELRRQAVPQARWPARSRFSTPFARCTRAGSGSRS